MRAALAGLLMLAGVGAAETAEPPAPEPPALPFLAEIEVDFALTDQTGRAVTEEDFAGRPMVVFFGYTNCDSICDVALPAMAAALEALGADAARIAPILITIDPAHDTPERLAEALPDWHPAMIGLTGSEAALSEVWARFQVDVTEIAVDPAGRPIYAHGSFIYLIGADGEVKTALPPILAPERMAELMRKYL